MLGNIWSASIVQSSYLELSLFSPRFVVLFMDDLGHISQWSSIVAGSLAGMVSMIVTYPTDLIKTRLIVQNMLEPSYKGLSHAFSTIYHQEGLLALYRGVSLTVLGKVELDTPSWHSYYIPSWTLKSILEASSDSERPGFKVPLKNAQLTGVFGVNILSRHSRISVLSTAFDRATHTEASVCRIQKDLVHHVVLDEVSHPVLWRLGF